MSGRGAGPVLTTDWRGGRANHRDLVTPPHLAGREAGGGAPRVFQAYHPILDEATAALDRAVQFLSAQLAGAERVTG
jgi:hypothetical protein